MQQKVPQFVFDAIDEASRNLLSINQAKALIQFLKAKEAERNPKDPD